MRTRTVGVALMVAGAVLLVASATADPLGLGGVPGVGWKQVTGMVVGAVVVVAGALRLQR